MLNSNCMNKSDLFLKAYSKTFTIQSVSDLSGGQVNSLEFDIAIEGYTVLGLPELISTHPSMLLITGFVFNNSKAYIYIKGTYPTNFDTTYRITVLYKKA